MKIVSVRLSDEEYASLQRRAGKGRGALSRLLRRLLAEPTAPVTAVSATETTSAAGRTVIECLGQYYRGGGTINLRSL